MSVLTKDRQEVVKEKFNRLFEENEGRLNGQRELPWHLWRKEAIEGFYGLEFPGRKNEDWKYTSPSKIFLNDYRVPEARFGYDKNQDLPFQVEGTDAHHLVFLNGIPEPEISNIGQLTEGVEIMPLRKAFESDKWGAICKPLLEESKAEAENAFVPLNHAFAEHGLFIYIGKNVILEKPIHLLFLSKSMREAPLANPLNLIVSESNSEATIVEQYESFDGEGAYFNNVVNKIEVGQNAILHHYRLQNESEEGFQVNQTFVKQAKDSTYSAYGVDLGGEIVRNNLNILLNASNTTTNMYGIYLAGGKQHIDNQTFIDHAHPHCYSNELYKGVLKDRGRGVFNGKVMVRQDAQKTNAFQQNSNLVLSENAVMDTKPQLEIYADDVKCSHGATVGQLDESSVFYMKSRGLSDEEARSMLQFAFLGEVLEHFKLESVKTYAERIILEKFDNH